MLTPLSNAPPRDEARAPRTGRRMLSGLVELTRPGQWPKNLLVVPLALVDPAAWHWFALPRLAWATTLFVLASVLVYVINDVSDRSLDRQHPVKRQRPLPSGKVSVSEACTMASLTGISLVLLLAMGPWPTGWPIALYLLINVLYSRGLKHVPIVDVLAVSAGFVLRIVFGALVVDAPLSGWLTISLLCASLLLSFGKRRQELRVLGESRAHEHRPVLRGYTNGLLDKLILLTAGLTVVAILLYLRTDVPSLLRHNLVVLVSAPFVIYGVFHYLQILATGRGGDPARELVRDCGLLVVSGLWAISVATLAVVGVHYLGWK